MGSALSRCTSRSPGRSPSGLSVPDIGQKTLDRQPNWLIPPARWRTKAVNQQPVRYRTPTPYPKKHRKPMVDSTENVDGSFIREKASIFEAPAVSHLDMRSNHRRQSLAESRNPNAQKPQPALRITWEVSPRLNRFERVV
ncbi:uncharacterized protein P884DRAFT_279804 [Thermothelomyces heterothallicus CBS 202.75]|uniref:uncharacterized protein n=1 Tax=Thermothelomyces heterothallicus CBS 202.75 TaxID=1149848 RepID=UPI00374293ED